MTIVGQRIPRPDAADKVKGTALYIEDLPAAGALVGGVLRSPHAHARIARLSVAAARRLPGVHAVLTAADIPGKNLIPMIQADWPVLAEKEVRHVGEGVALVAAESKDALAAALAAIEVEYEPLPARLDMEESARAGDVIAHWKVRRGDHAVGLDVGVLLVRGVVRALDHDQVAARERDRGLAAADLVAGHHLAGRERFLHVEHRRQRLVLDLDRGQPFGQRLARVGRDHRDALPHVPHEVLGQDRPVRLDHGDDVAAGDLARRDHGAHTGDGPRPGRVQLADARVRVRRAEHPAPQRAGEVQVLDVEGRALHLVGRVGAPQALADHCARGGVEGHGKGEIAVRMNEPRRTFKRRRGLAPGLPFRASSGP